MREVIDLLCLLMAGWFLASAFVRVVRRAPKEDVIPSMLMAIILLTAAGL